MFAKLTGVFKCFHMGAGGGGRRGGGETDILVGQSETIQKTLTSSSKVDDATSQCHDWLALVSWTTFKAIDARRTHLPGPYLGAL